MKSRSAASLAAIIAISAALIGAWLAFSGPSRPPNLILISIDTLRADHVGAYGYPRPTTPAIDQLARESVVFKTCIAHAPTTLSSHASILTSSLPIHHGASIGRFSSLSPDVTTLAEVLRANGYSTGSFNGGIQLDPIYGLGRGFDVYESVVAMFSPAAALAGSENRMSTRVDRSLAWIEETSQPFFLFLHSYEIHHPYTPDDEYLDLFAREYDGPLGNHIDVDLLKAVHKRKKTLTDEDIQHVIDAYDAELRSVDDALGRFFAELRRRGLDENTMIILTSDHGEEFGERGSVGWHSHTLYDELLLVPLIMRLPSRRSGGIVVENQVRGIDVAPTALAALGIEIPATFMGEDLSLEIAGEGDRSLPALSMFDRRAKKPMWALRSDGWKAFFLQPRSLFDLSGDEGETTNLIRSGSDRMSSMRQMGIDLMDSRTAAPVTPAVVTDDTVERLRALGYVEPDE